LKIDRTLVHNGERWKGGEGLGEKRRGRELAREPEKNSIMRLRGGYRKNGDLMDKRSRGKTSTGKKGIPVQKKDIAGGDR